MRMSKTIHQIRFVASSIRVDMVPITTEVNVLKSWQSVLTYMSEKRAQVPNE